jgi:hypothetical protein
MATLIKNEVIATLKEGHTQAEFFTIGSKAFNVESTSVDLATQCYEACSEFYMVTPSKLPVSMYSGLSNGVITEYSKGIGAENECFLAKVENLWQYVTKPVFDKAQGFKQHVTNNWLITTDFKKLKSGKLNFGSDDGKAIAGMTQARKDKVLGQVNTVITRLQKKAKSLFSVDSEQDEKPSTFELSKMLDKIIAKSEKYDDENPVLLKKLFDDVISKYNLA